MKRLTKYRKLDLLDINIQYGQKKISFNLYDELRITEDLIDSEIKHQPSHYGFLLLLHKKLLTQFEHLKQRRDQVWAKLYLRGKNKNQSGTSRPYTEDMAKAYADSHKEYVSITEACIKAKDSADSIFAAVKAFEQRKDMLQTLSSNNRKQF